MRFSSKTELKKFDVHCLRADANEKKPQLFFPQWLHLHCFSLPFEKDFLYYKDIIQKYLVRQMH